MAAFLLSVFVGFIAVAMAWGGSPPAKIKAEKSLENTGLIVGFFFAIVATCIARFL